MELLRAAPKGVEWLGKEKGDVEEVGSSVVILRLRKQKAKQYSVSITLSRINAY